MVQGCRTSLAEAYFWAYIAAENDEKYLILRNRLAAELKTEDHRQTVVRARAWIKRFDLEKR